MRITQTQATLRPGPHVAALHASRYAAGWCDGCGRRRGADGRCNACDSWWTSPFYVYGSLLTLSVTALLLTVLPLLRPAYAGTEVASAPTAAVLVSPPSTTTTFLAPPALNPYRPAIVAASAAPTVLRPVPAAPGANSVAEADLAHLRAMTDFAASTETNRESARALAGGPPPTMMRLPVVAVQPLPQPAAPAVAAPQIVPAPIDPVDAAARDADAAKTL